ncbi:hypothetical protein PHMEG_0009813 [Phytophthora megakarya]|uniref:Eukaryotic/viral aspartic protease n=1 Tax=Phytophthora megakarya TaxID=4795 RepID=A0A225WFK6_9STRA|nr:hypothetical protein PHMEG_0009813 [Phytophthora megakarya]
MTRVPGSSGDSGFHRESQEEVQVKTEQGNEMSSYARSTTTLLNARSADRQSARKDSVEVRPIRIPIWKRNLILHKSPTWGLLRILTRVKIPLYLPKDTQVSGSEVGKPRSKTVLKKMKAPDDEEDEVHHGSGWSEEDLKSMYHRKELRDFVDQDPAMRILKLKRIADPKEPVTAPATLTDRFNATMELIRLLKEAGMVPGPFDADTLFDLDLDVIQASSRDLFQKLKILVGEVPQNPYPLPLTTTDAVDNLTVSSHYASDESPLDYLYRINVVGLRARLNIKDGSAKERSEHVDHYIETLEDQDLAERLTLLRLTDADALEEILRARDRAKNRQKKAAFGSSKYRQKPTNSTPIFLAASEDVTPKVEKELGA